MCAVVRPSVTFVDQDHIGCKSWKLIAQTIRPTPSLFVAQRPSTYTFRGIWGNSEETRGESLGKVVCRSTKAAISLKCVKIEEKLLWSAYRNSSTLFRTVPSRTALRPSVPEDCGLQPPTKTPITIISWAGKSTNFKFCTRPRDWSERKSICRENSCGRSQESQNFSEHPSCGHLCDHSAFLFSVGYV